MKIDQNRAVEAPPVAAVTNKTSSAGAARPAAVTQSVGSVNISETSRSLSTSSTNSESPFDAKRVDAIKTAISAGHFKVNPEAVADKILNSASSLLSGS
jgi:negative regulator of flagellin synthesis FlgM